MKVKKKVGKKKAKRQLADVPTLMAQGIKDYICLFYGPPGVGKTAFVNSLAPRVLFISTDRGTRYFEGLREEVNSWEDLMEVADALEDGPSYDMICIDHVDDIVQMAEEFTCNELGVEALGDADWGKGWRGFRKCLHDLMGKLKAADAGIVFICHEVVKEITTRAIKVDRTQPDMGKIAWKTIIPLADLVGYLGFRRIKQRGKEAKEIRTLETVPTEAVYVKDRTKRRKPKKGYEVLGVPPTGGQAFVATFEGEASGKEEGKVGKKVGKKGRKKVGRRSR